MLSPKLDKPMQVMISLEDEEIVSFIQTVGFSCRRKCYEIEASVQDYVGKKTKGSLSFAMLGHPIYTKEDFFMMLPKVVCYEMDNDRIKNLAFVEDNEIAYVCGADRVGFILFAQNLITELFKQNEVIMFEADDCDEYAMELKNLFANQLEESFDTYIL